MDRSDVERIREPSRNAAIAAPARARHRATPLLLIAALPSLARGQAAIGIEAATLFAPDAASGDNVGSAVALDGARAVVAAPFDVSAIGVKTGSASLFERQSNGIWRFVARLEPDDGAFSDAFGTSAALSGNRVLVGAKNAATAAGSWAGSAYAFERQGDGTWLQTAKLLPVGQQAGDEFGVSMSLDGERALIGAHLDDTIALHAADGAAYMFEVQGNGTWLEVATLRASDPNWSAVFGHAVSLSGDRALVGAHGAHTPAGQNAGAAYVFERQGNGAWLQVAKLIASDGEEYEWFGWSVALSGERAVVGCHQDDIGTQTDAGSAYVYERQGDGSWLQTAKLTASDGAKFDEFGYSVALQGSRALVGARGDYGVTPIHGGSAYVFERQADGTWLELSKLISSHAGFGPQLGQAVALSGDRALAGAPFADTLAGIDTGSAQVFRLCDGCLVPYGTGTPGCTGTQTMFANLPPELGMQGFRFTCDHAPIAGVGIGAFAPVADPAGTDLFGLGFLLHLDLVASPAHVRFALVSDGTGSALGPPFTLPVDPSMAGLTLYAQSVWPWSTCPLPPAGFSSSRGLAFTLLAP